MFTVRRQWALHEDEALAHRLQDEESEKYKDLKKKEFGVWCGRGGS